MWATGRYVFGLSEEDFWNLTPGMWMALQEERMNELKIYDAFQARITSMIRATAMTSKKSRVKEEDFKFFKTSTSKTRPSTGDLKAKFLGIASVVNAQIAAKKANK
jgi:hypothetical protein